MRLNTCCVKKRTRHHVVLPSLVLLSRGGGTHHQADHDPGTHLVASWPGRSAKVQNDNHAQVDDHHFDEFNPAAARKVTTRQRNVTKSEDAAYRVLCPVLESHGGTRSIESSIPGALLAAGVTVQISRNSLPADRTHNDGLGNALKSEKDPPRCCHLFRFENTCFRSLAIGIWRFRRHRTAVLPLDPFRTGAREQRGPKTTVRRPATSVGLT
jgi:hypothetical protein